MDISSKISATHENSKDGIREAAEFAEGAAQRKKEWEWRICVREVRSALGGVGVDVVRYYVGA